MPGSAFKRRFSPGAILTRSGRRVRSDRLVGHFTRISCLPCLAASRRSGGGFPEGGTGRQDASLRCGIRSTTPAVRPAVQVQVVGVCGVVLGPEDAVEETASSVVDAPQEGRPFIVAAPMRSDYGSPAVFEHESSHIQRVGRGVLAGRPPSRPLTLRQAKLP